MAVIEARNGVAVAVVNLLGQLFLATPISPWEMVDALVEEARAAAPVVFFDFHAEATSEKVAMATWLDGRVTAVIGTHTHIQTNDARILPGGTAALSDAGMTGPHDSVIGVRSELAIARMRTRLPVRFEPAEGDVRLEGALVTCTDAGRAEAIELVRVPAWLRRYYLGRAGNVPWLARTSRSAGFFLRALGSPAWTAVREPAMSGTRRRSSVHPDCGAL